MKMVDAPNLSPVVQEELQSADIAYAFVKIGEVEAS